MAQDANQSAPTDAVQTKSVLASKTYWVNMALAAATELSPSFMHWAGSHPQTLILGIAAMNVALRHFSNTPLSIKGGVK